MTKQDAIKNAYGEYYSQCKPDENGWTEVDESLGGYEFLDDEIDYYEFESSNKWRPITLRDIENNKGWTKINSESDIKVTHEEMWVKHNDGDILILYATKEHLLKNCTHYKLIITPEPPIY